MRRRFGLVIGLTVVAGCAATPFPDGMRPRPSDHPGAAAVVLEDDLALRFRSDPTSGRPIAETTQRVRLYVLRDGADDWTLIRIARRFTESSPPAFSARTIAPDGTVRSYGRWSLSVRRSSESSTPFGDGDEWTARLGPAVPGTLVEYQYTERDEDLELSQLGDRFGASAPIEHARFTVSAPSDWKVAWVAERHGQPVDFSPHVTTDHRETRLVWEQRHLEALPREPSGPWPAERAVVVTPRLERWTESGVWKTAPADARGLSAWLYRLTRLDPLDDRVAAKARSLVADDPPDSAIRTRHLLNWVRDHDCADLIAERLTPSQTHGGGALARLRDSDCGDPATMLHQMLAAVNIPSYRVLSHTHVGLPQPFDPVSRSVNHVMVAVRLADGDVLTDPSAIATPFGELPIWDQEADYLPLVEGGAPVGRAPGSRAEDNGRLLEITLAPANEDLVGTFRVAARGAQAIWLRSQLQKVWPQDFGPSLASTLMVDPTRLTSWEVEAWAPPDEPAPVRVSGGMTFPRVWTAAGRRMLSLANLLEPQVPSLAAGPRKTGLLFPVRRQAATVIRIAVGEASIPTLPAPVTLERPYGHYELRWSREGQELLARETFELREHVFAVEQYDEVRQFFEQILIAEATPIALNEATP